MPDLALTDVTYTVKNRKVAEELRINYVTALFGDGALTYPAGGVPLDKEALGHNNALEALTIVEPSAGDGFVYKVVGWLVFWFVILEHALHSMR